MNLVAAVTVAVLFGAGAYVLQKRDLVRIVAGMILLSNAANVFILSTTLDYAAAPIRPFPEDIDVGEPLPQALALTAVVITLGISTLLLAVGWRAYQAFRTLDVAELFAAEVRAGEEDGEEAS